MKYILILLLVFCGSMYPVPKNKQCNGEIVMKYYNDGKVVYKLSGAGMLMVSRDLERYAEGKMYVTDSVVYKIEYK